MSSDVPNVPAENGNTTDDVTSSVDITSVDTTDVQNETVSADPADTVPISAKGKSRIPVIGATVAVIVTLLLVGVAVFLSQKQNTPAPVPSPAGSASGSNVPVVVPNGVMPGTHEYAYSVLYDRVPADVDMTKAPILAVWGDFQCPGCGILEQRVGAEYKRLADEGKIWLVWRPTTFLDMKLENDSSVRATSAWGCAIDEGKAMEYHDIVYANQPEREGEGWTDEQLLSFGKETGLTGDQYNRFAECVASKKYVPWAEASTQIFFDSNVQGTPTGFLNGERIPNDILGDPATLEQILDNVANSSSPAPAAS